MAFQQISQLLSASKSLRTNTEALLMAEGVWVLTEDEKKAIREVVLPSLSKVVETAILLNNRRKQR